jgi:glycosyltransferase involved in cell wall biosynthesis
VTTHFVPNPSGLNCTAVLTHHWLVRRRGGEKVLEALAELVPDAPIYTLVHDPPGLADSPLAERTVHASPLQHLPGARRHYDKLLALLGLAARAVRLPPADLVICSDAAVAKAMRPHPDSKLVCYCHSPMRYVYEPAVRQAYAQRLPLGLRPLFNLAAAIVRRTDEQAARRVDLFVANSRHVAQRIYRCYGAEAVVVYPPVDLPSTPTKTAREDFYLCVGFHARYKRLDLAVEATRQLGRKLVVIGSGPDLDCIHPQRDAHVTALGWQPEDVMVDHLCRARGLLFPGEEDFGIVPVEAIARGCPVIAYAVGGATETVVDGQTGVWFRSQTPRDLASAIGRAEQISFEPDAMLDSVQKFSRARFLDEMRSVLQSVL